MHMFDNSFYSLFHKTSLNNELRCLTQYIDRYGPGDQGIKVTLPTEMRFFFSVQRPDQLWGPPSLQWVLKDIFLGVKQA